MIFIKNLTSFEGKDFALTLTQNSGALTLSIGLPNKAVVDLLKSNVEGVYGSMKKSLENIGKKTHNLSKNGQGDGKTVTTQLLDKYPTEVTFYVKDKKIALNRPKAEPWIPVDINIVPDADMDKRFPRDIIAMIVPKRTEDGAKLEYDPRNLIGKPIIATAEDYQVIMAMIKWPIWSNLKFPVYLSIVDSEDAIGSIQLSSKTENNVTRNQIVDTDNDTALDYLQESKKIMEEKMETARNQKQQDRNKKFNGNQKKNYGNKGGTNTKGYGGNGKNYGRNGQR